MCQPTFIISLEPLNEPDRKHWCDVVGCQNTVLFYDEKADCWVCWQCGELKLRGDHQWWTHEPLDAVVQVRGKIMTAREQLEWSLETPLSRRNKVGQCPYCGNLKNIGHDSECAFLDPKKSTESIKQEIEDAKRQSAKEMANLWGVKP